MKFTPSLAGAMSGSMGGCTASRNRGGQYFRRRSIPTDPVSGRQEAIRGIMSTLSSAWGSVLTTAQRQGWDTYAANTPRTDVLGQQFYLTGQQAYISCNVPRLQAMLARVDAAPTAYNNGESITLIRTNSLNNTCELTGSSLEMGFEFQAPLSGDATLLLFAGLLLNPTVKYYKGPYQLAATLDLAANDTTKTLTVDTATAAWKALNFPSIEMFQGFCARISYDDGRLSMMHNAIVYTLEGV